MSENSGVDIKQAAEDFWQSSLAFYEKPEVSTYLLGLQNNHLKNVNEVLFALWLSHKYHIELTEELANSAHRRTKRSKKWVQNIRDTRLELEAQWQKPFPEKIAKTRQALLDTEIEIEKLHQQKLVEEVFTHPKFENLCASPLAHEALLFVNLICLCGKPKSDYKQVVMMWIDYLGEPN